MKKEVFYDKNALKEIWKFNKNIQKEFLALVEILETEGQLSQPEAKKVIHNLLEMRIQHGGAYRGLYAYIKRDYIVILHCFQKKTRKTPLKNIKIAKQRLHYYV